MVASSSTTAWQHILNSLERISVKKGNDTRTTPSPQAGTRARSPTISDILRPARVGPYLEIVENYSNTVIGVYWSDPQSGRYGEQKWKLGKASGRAVCALSGEQVRRGDEVFRPSMRGQSPANADWVILASALRARI
jgi:hypothetical protein